MYLEQEVSEKGYATESLRTVITYLFAELNKHRIFASIDPGNENSIRLVERLGFRKEANLVESLFVNGKWEDDLIYSLIEKDWEKINLMQK